MKLTPLADRVILKMLEAEETTKGGIILTASAKEFPTASLRTGDAAQGGWIKVFLPRTCRGKNNLNYFRVPRNF